MWKLTLGCGSVTHPLFASVGGGGVEMPLPLTITHDIKYSRKPPWPTTTHSPTHPLKLPLNLPYLS
jgi:hypothetical protein